MPPKKETTSHAAADANRAKVAELKKMVDEVLAEMQVDNPADPIASLMRRLGRHTFEVEHGDGRELTRHVRENQYPKELDERPLSIVIFGASGDLAKKKTFAGLFHLFRNGYLPRNTSFVGYARSKLSVDDLKEDTTTKLPTDAKGDIDDFFDRVSYVSGQYDEEDDYKKLAEHLEKQERAAAEQCEKKASKSAASANRIFYLVVPPDVFLDVAKRVKKTLTNTGEGWFRVLVEKPFGHSYASSDELTAELLKLYKEEQMCRIDHYLGKEVLRSILPLRFSNHIFSAVWNRHHIANVQITFKETEGVTSRGEYYDKFGVIRDVMQNHLIQILTMVTMEKPKSLDAEDIRDARAQLLKQIKPIDKANAVLGQYTAPPQRDSKTKGEKGDDDDKTPGFREDDDVDDNSNTPTFAAFTLFIDNDRWRDVPFTFKSGKGLNEKVALARIQFKEESFGDDKVRNELVMRIQPDEAVFLTVGSKAPGINAKDLTITDMDLTYKERFEAIRIAEAYEPLLYEAIVGNMTNCVRSDELQAAWAIFTPLLEAIEARAIKCEPYPMGSRGPTGADALAERFGYQRIRDYEWRKASSKPDEQADDKQREAESEQGQFEAVKASKSGDT